MARQRQADGSEEMIVMGGGSPEEVDLPPVGPSGEVVADATLKNAPETPEVIETVLKPDRYQVIKGGFILTRSGYRTNLQEGKVVDSFNYDIKGLQKQGIRLQAVSDSDL